MMALDDMISVLQSFKEGKKIQVRSLDPNVLIWSECKEPGWYFGDFDYRVKLVEPKFIYVAESRLESLHDKYEGMAYGISDDEPGERVKYIELTPEVRATLTEKGILKC